MFATLLILAAVAIIAAPAPDDDATDRTARQASRRQWPVAEKIVAELQRGIPPQHGMRGGRQTPATKALHNRTWTVANLKATFGEPSNVNDTRTSWKWQRADGTAKVQFTSKGYGNSTTGTALQIVAAHFHPLPAKPAVP